MAWLTSARGNGYTDVDAVWRKAGISPKMIQVLAEADAFHSLGLPRRAALWAAKAITADRPLPLFSQNLEGECIVEPQVHLPQMTEGEAVVEDYVSMRLTLRAHPVALIRHRLTPGMGQRPVAAVVVGKGVAHVGKRQPQRVGADLQSNSQNLKIVSG